MTAGQKEPTRIPNPHASRENSKWRCCGVKPTCQTHAHTTGTFRNSPTKSPTSGNCCLHFHSRRPLLLSRRGGGGGGGMGAEYPTFSDVSGASDLLFLADSTPASPPPLAALRYLLACLTSLPSEFHAPARASDELSCYSGSSSSSSYSGASARSCVSDSARRGRPVDPLRVLSVVASLRLINPKRATAIARTDGSGRWLQVLAEATSTLFHRGEEKKRKGVWIEIDSFHDDDDDQSERSSAVASEGSTVTAAASAGSTATSGRCRRPPRRSGDDGGEKALRRADVIMQWFSRPGAGPATENDIRAAVGDNSGTGKAIRW
ncbi:hypothetical protein HU200_052176 [Digitaria exilis]|uniref:Uncharacterized protein n=1 Tax=Digitaria exilis TaxID=1010633 RepID=A0A835AM42_9POAL|nr:hypothetical protein HU200_052176 [Digitaria exilis]